MKQVSKQRSIKKKAKRKKKSLCVGTSKLETDFARDFLDKLGVEYIWQFEAKDIKRWYDFYLPKHNLIIELMGGIGIPTHESLTNNILIPLKNAIKELMSIRTNGRLCMAYL